MRTLYEDLGIEPSATLDQVKTAYRKLAMKYHPDRGGDPVKFKCVQNAYEVLSDPERRLKYDADGTTEQEITMRQAAERMIPQLANEAINVCMFPDHVDLVWEMRRNVESILQQDQKAQATAVDTRDRLKKVMKRFKRKGIGENMVVGALQAKIAEIGVFLEKNTEHQLFLGEVLEVLKDYSYDWGEPETLLLESET